MKKATIEVLLATYNSERYLREQIDSIIGQDCDNWKLLIRDGGSSDRTLDIIQEYGSKYPELIRFIPSSGRFSAIENFSALLEASTALYVMFADHDDLWLNNKISNSLTEMKKSEKFFGSDTPLLVFTDMYIVDENLNRLSCSYFKYQKINPLRTSLNYLLIQNIPNACTMLINRQLINLVERIPSTAVMHDHWLCLTAKVFGEIVYLNEPSLYYRQHKNNIFGAQKYGTKYLSDRFISGKKELRERFFRNVDQASTFLNTYGARIPLEQAKMMEDFAHLKNYSGIKACSTLIKHKILKHGIMRNLGMFYILL